MIDLAQAFLHASEERPDLAEAAMARIRARDRRRRAVILGSAAAGIGVALAALFAAGVLEPGVPIRLAELALEPWAIAALGLGLTALAWRETRMEL
jgi:ATP/maltotriose-dependent transcriptional regulator MalT